MAKRRRPRRNWADFAWILIFAVGAMAALYVLLGILVLASMVAR